MKENSVTKNFNIRENAVANSQRVLCEVFKESDEYFKGLKKAESQKEIEPYVMIHSVGSEISIFQPGDYALMRNDLAPVCFKLGERQYTVLYESDLILKISPELKDYMTNERISQEGRSKLDIVN